MTHLHVPDGVLPLWLVGLGWVVAIALLAAASIASRRKGRARKVALLGVVSAFVLVAMSLEIVPIAYHVNLTVAAGILLGPWLGLVCAFVVSTLLALLGHGGVTVIGLNTVLLGAEIVLGWALFRGFVRAMGRPRAGWAAGVATPLTLATTTAMLVGVVALAGSAWTAQPTGALDPDTLSFSTADTSHEETDGEAEDAHGHEDAPSLSVGRFATVVFVLGPLGWAIEAVITGGVVGFVSRIRPDLVFADEPPRAHRMVGDEQGGH